MIQVTTYPHRIHVGRPHLSLWFVVAALAAALVGLGAWVLVDRYVGGGGATQDATSLIDRFNAAATNDGAAVSALLTSDAVLWSAETPIVGAKAIANQIANTPGLLIERVAPVTVKGNFATTFIRFSAVGGAIKNAPMLMVTELKDGKIFRIWTFALGETTPFNNTATPSF